MSDKPTILGGLWRFISFWKVRKALGLGPLPDDQIFAHRIQGLGQAVTEAIEAATVLGEEVREFVRRASEKAGLKP